jgi:type II secretory ATPase GspE/PulE/Tfp pilus assembly ATPase PilB-like protein
VIMVGEIRDAETAGIAMNTALTGHLLLSTLHTSDSATTLPRLLDMGIDAYLVASTVNLAIGQRLVRKICPACKEEAILSETEHEALMETLPKRMQNAHTFYKGKGCDECRGSGFKGRIGINEVLVVDGKVRDAILKKGVRFSHKNIAIEDGMTTMFEDGFEKALKGLTTISEVLRTMINE